MKKYLALLLIAAMMLGLAACGPKEKDFIGKYTCEAVEAADVIVNPTDLGVDAYIKLKEGGEGTLYFEEKMDLEWEIVDEDTLILTADGDDLEVDVEAGVLVLEIEDVGTMWFVGEDAELPEDVQDDLESSGLGNLLSGLLGGTDVAVDEAPVEETTEYATESAVAEEAPEAEMFEEASPVEVEIPTDAEDFLTETAVTLGDYEVIFQGAELFTDSEGYDAIRIYYDFYNNSDETDMAWSALSYEVYQGNTVCESTWADYDYAVEEENNSLRYVRPGCGIRCVAEYRIESATEPVIFNVCDWYSTDEFTLRIDLATCPEMPSGLFVYAPVADPTWTDALSDRGELDDGSEVYIDSAETFIDEFTGEKCIRVFFEYTNKTDEITTPFMSMSAYFLQDGVELEMNYSMEEDTDGAFFDEVDPGETVTCSACAFLRSESGVEVEIMNWGVESIGRAFIKE